ncbi:MAG: hypothetical protein OK456_05730 [Thaumarchaeota archaeon]|nr:hypothetical protein [Nitrososphaerota archaeon]
MPREIKSREEFEKLLPMATEIRVVRGKDDSDEKEGDSKGAAGTSQTKIKIRTGNRLYTFKTTDDDADSLVKGTKTPVVEY